MADPIDEQRFAHMITDHGQVAHIVARPLVAGRAQTALCGTVTHHRAGASLFYSTMPTCRRCAAKNT